MAGLEVRTGHRRQFVGLQKTPTQSVNENDQTGSLCKPGIRTCGFAQVQGLQKFQNDTVMETQVAADSPLFSIGSGGNEALPAGRSGKTRSGFNSKSFSFGVKKNDKYEKALKQIFGESGESIKDDEDDEKKLKSATRKVIPEEENRNEATIPMRTPTKQNHFNKGEHGTSMRLLSLHGNKSLQKPEIKRCESLRHLIFQSPLPYIRKDVQTPATKSIVFQNSQVTKEVNAPSTKSEQIITSSPADKGNQCQYLPRPPIPTPRASLLKPDKEGGNAPKLTKQYPLPIPRTLKRFEWRDTNNGIVGIVTAIAGIKSTYPNNKDNGNELGHDSENSSKAISNVDGTAHDKYGDDYVCKLGALQLHEFVNTYQQS